MKRVLTLFMTMLFLCGCAATENEAEKLRDLDFTVISSQNIPEELNAELEEKKTESFKMTYADANYLYLCVGYGKQSSGGYSITVDDLYLTENAIYLDTTLLGPSSEEAKMQAASYPYLVIRMEYMEQPVIFE